jgi:hypothetical protein
VQAGEQQTEFGGKLFVDGVLVAVAEYDEGGDRLPGGVVCGADDRD